MVLAQIIPADAVGDGVHFEGLDELSGVLVLDAHLDNVCRVVVGNQYVVGVVHQTNRLDDGGVIVRVLGLFLQNVERLEVTLHGVFVSEMGVFGRAGLGEKFGHRDACLGVFGETHRELGRLLVSFLVAAASGIVVVFRVDDFRAGRRGRTFPDQGTTTEFLYLSFHFFLRQFLVAAGRFGTKECPGHELFDVSGTAAVAVAAGCVVVRGVFLVGVLVFVVSAVPSEAAAAAHDAFTAVAGQGESYPLGVARFKNGHDGVHF
mmetsp:Transcript_4124/g.8905  ORF Transcript_4124/g.8905 Transcript_4124/m.8905 type:complete len:262 (-) Transcript_4124:619-1404(-)